MKVKKLRSLFEITNTKYKIYAEVFEGEDKITLRTYTWHNKFWFEKSKPEDIKNIGKLIAEASKLKIKKGNIKWH